MVRDPKPAMARLVRYLSDDPHDQVATLALALRAALGQCGEQQALAVDEITELDAEDGDQGVAGRRHRARCLATLEMANRVVRVISEQVEQLDGGSR